jgi:DNA-binding MarR family transcriptional regulator
VRPSPEDRERFMSLSEGGREKLRQAMHDNREKMMNSTPEERMKFAKELFERIAAEDKSKRD